MNVLFYLNLEFTSVALALSSQETTLDIFGCTYTCIWNFFKTPLCQNEFANIRLDFSFVGFMIPQGFKFQERPPDTKHLNDSFKIVSILLYLNYNIALAFLKMFKSLFYIIIYFLFNLDRATISSAHKVRGQE